MCIGVKRILKGNLDIPKCRVSMYWGKIEIWRGQLCLKEF